MVLRVYVYTCTYTCTVLAALCWLFCTQGGSPLLRMHVGVGRRVGCGDTRLCACSRVCSSSGMCCSQVVVSFARLFACTYYYVVYTGTCVIARR
jgi:hypothetical protein